jgi:glucose-1-phosphate thymidylyltransferase
VSKQLLPVYDKPMIYYPISTLMLAGIREILIITTAQDQHLFQQLLGDGTEFGISFDYAIQSEPKGLAQAFTIGEDFISGQSSLMILGDNLFHGAGLGRDLIRGLPTSGAHLFTCEVSNPDAYGILEIGENDLPISITEKPTSYISNTAVTGLYFFDEDVVEVAKCITPSNRGELEITSIIEFYLKAKSLSFTRLSRGSAWLDTGNPDSLQDAAAYVKIIEDRTGLKIACLEEIAFKNGWIDGNQIQQSIKKYSNSDYGRYLVALLARH